MGGKAVANLKLGLITHSFSLGKFYHDDYSAWPDVIPSGAKQVYPNKFWAIQAGSSLGAWWNNAAYSATDDFGNCFRHMAAMNGQVDKVIICNILGEDFGEYDSIVAGGVVSTATEIVDLHSEFINEQLIGRFRLNPKNIMVVTGCPIVRSAFGNINSEVSTYQNSQLGNHNMYIFSQEAKRRMPTGVVVSDTFGAVVADYGTTNAGIDSFVADYLISAAPPAWTHTNDVTGRAFVARYMQSDIDAFIR